MNQVEELHLIQRACQGDLEAFNQLILEYQTLVFNHALWMVHDRETAEDVTQETFLSAYQNINQYRGGSFRAWLLRIVTNASLDELRRQKRRQTIPLFSYNHDGEEIEVDDWLVDSGPSVEEQSMQRDLRVSLQRHICALPEEYRNAVLLVDVFEMEYAEAAEVMGVPIGTVKSRLARARLLLRRRLENGRDSLAYPLLESA